MRKEQVLLNSFSLVCIGSGQELIVLKPYCVDVITECDHLNLAIIGIDGYFRSNEKIMPNLNEIADFSSLSRDVWIEFQKESIKAAADFITTMTSIGKSDVYGFTFIDHWECENHD